MSNFLSWADWFLLEGTEASEETYEAWADLIEAANDAAEEGDAEASILGHLLAWPPNE